MPFFFCSFLLIIILISVFGLILFVPTQDEATITKSRSALSAKAPFKLKKGRADYFFMLLRDPAINKIPDNIHEKEIRFYELLKTNLSKQNAATSITWKEAGPFKVGGRTRALAIDINNPNVIIAGGASGGLWKSTDKGVTWSLKSTPSQIIGISSVAQDPRAGHTNTWYYSTGEYIGNSASDRGYTASYYGSGIYKSTDNGETWKLLDITKTNPVQWSVFSFGSKIVVHPVNGYVFVALNGLGIVRSDNGGESFALSLGGVNEHVFSDITIASDNTLIASISSGYPNWPTPKNNPGIYKSKDYGVKWTSLTPDNFPATHMRTVIGAAPSNANTAYILTYTGSQKDNRDEIKFYKLNVSNGSYEDRTENLPDFGNNLEDYINTQQNYNMIIAIKPDDENFVLIGATSLFRSTNGFMTKPNNSKDQWIGGYNPKTFFYPNLHPDVHSFSFDPTDPNKMWWGHDGGLSYTADIRNTNYTELFPWENKNNGYNVTQFYHITIPDIPNDPKIMGGTQDNGTPYFCCDGISTTEFYDVSSGDGS